MSHNTDSNLLISQEMYSPTIVFGGVDRAVGEVGSSTDLRQTLSVEEGPGAPMVGGKLQADAGNTRMSTTKKCKH